MVNYDKNICYYVYQAYLRLINLLPRIFEVDKFVTML